MKTNLIFVPSEAAAFHGAGVEVALVVELEAGQAGVQLVEDGRQAATQCQQLGACAVEANTHGALQGHAASVTQQGAERTEEEKILDKLMFVSTNPLFFFFFK